MVLSSPSGKKKGHEIINWRTEGKGGWEGGKEERGGVLGGEGGWKGGGADGRRKEDSRRGEGW